MSSRLIDRTIGDWVLRQRVPPGPPPYALILLLHGWTGDENAMWVFASRMPKDALLVALRGIYETPLGGYGWHPHRARGWPWVDEFQPAVEGLVDLLAPENFPEADPSSIRLVGFSQGAALCYAWAMQHPQKIKSLAGLSGFLPEGAEALARNRPLLGKTVFVAHGTQDELVPVVRARQAAQVLEQAGALVTYCEDDVGHKLSSNCFRGLQEFFSY